MNLRPVLLLFGALFGLLLLASCADEPAPPPVADPNTRINAPAGEVIGFTQDGVRHWRGLPYARPPVGELRWKAPRSAPAWEGLRDATEFASYCIQIGGPLGGVPNSEFGKVTGSEDCLYLNISVPENIPQGTKLPVMFWIHGGANIIGTSNVYDFSALVRAENVIVVTINYRLGPFGWFAHEAVQAQAETIIDESPNQAILDMVEALKWVNKNIGAFGGDADNVTIFGESAGGVNVFALLVAPQSKNLFHRAIAQSGTLRTASLNWARNRSPSSARNMAEIWKRKFPNAPTGDSAATLKWMQDLDGGALLWTYLHGKDPGYGMRVRSPTIIADKLVIAEDGLWGGFSRGDYHRVPIITGTNRDEMKLFMALNPELTDSWFGGVQILLKDEGVYNRTAHYTSMAWKTISVDTLAHALHSPVWTYQFDWDEASSFLWTDFSKVFGAAHAFEIPFITGTFQLGSLGNVLFTEDNMPAAKKLSQQMMAYWAEFARSGKPGDGMGKAAQWNPWTRKVPEQMVLDTDADGGLRMEKSHSLPLNLLDKIAADTEFSNTLERCSTLLYVMDWMRPLVSDEGSKMHKSYKSWNGGICAEVEPVTL